MTSRLIPVNTAAEVRRRLGIKFGRHSGAVVVPEHLVLFEVAARESTWRQRRIDVVAVGLLKRTDYLIHGFEVKISRADLRSELREPKKAAASAQYCDRWWLALSSLDLLRDDDPVPEHWGVIACSGRGMRIHRQPAPIERVESPVFRAALLHAGQRTPGYRRAMGYQVGLQRGLEHNRGEVDRAYKRGVQHGIYKAKYDAEQATA